MDATSCRIYCRKQHRHSLRARAKKAGNQSCRQNFRFQWRSGRNQENDVQDFRVLELFSGIGGMHYAVKRILPTCYVEAVDINTVANKVYEHNFGERPHTLDLNQITWDTLDSYGADMWCLSPPCQPYTRTVFGKRLDASDTRARSLIRLLEQLPLMQRPPTYLIMENVEGFVGGEVHGLLKEALLACSYQLQEFVVSPHQLGVPYLRSRYFALASYLTAGDNLSSHCTRQLPTYLGSKNESVELFGKEYSSPGHRINEHHDGLMTQHPPFLPLDVLDVAMTGSRLQGWPELLKRSQLSRNDDEPRGELGYVPSGMQALTTSPHPHLSPSTGNANSPYLHVLEREEVGGMRSSTAPIDTDWPPSTPSGQADISDITSNCIPLFYYLEQEKPPSNRDNGGRAEHIAAGISHQQQHNALPCKEPGTAAADEGSLGLLGHGPGAMKSSRIMSQSGVPALHTGLDLMAAGASHAAGSTALLVSSGCSSSNINIWRKHAVPTQILQKHWKVFDVVTAASTHTNCITKHYSNLSLGAGSVLASTSFAKQYCTTDSRGRMHIPTNPLQGLQTTSGTFLHADSSEPSSCRATGNHAWKRVQGGGAIPTGDEDCSSSVESSDRELDPAGHEVPNVREIFPGSTSMPDHLNPPTISKMTSSSTHKSMNVLGADAPSSVNTVSCDLKRASSSTTKCLPEEATCEPWNEHEMEWNQDDSIIARPRGACDNDLLLSSDDQDRLIGLRYLTPREVANLHGFPQPSELPGRQTLGGCADGVHALTNTLLNASGSSDIAMSSHAVGEDVEEKQRGVAQCFSFPPGITSRQAYALLGNSLSVDVFAYLLAHLLYTSRKGAL